MVKFKFDKPLVLKGREYSAGTTVDLDPTDADKLEAAGFGSKVKAAKKKAAAKDDG